MLSSNAKPKRERFRPSTQNYVYLSEKTPPVFRKFQFFFHIYLNTQFSNNLRKQKTCIQK
jgi:hypothetical protein